MVYFNGCNRNRNRNHGCAIEIQDMGCLNYIGEYSMLTAEPDLDFAWP